jgi:type IV pilus assembly protein PilY1
VGANDGMLHAFDAKTGEEQFAYIPSSVLPRLKALASPGFDTSHQYFVDGDVSVTSQSQTPGKNVLVAALGRGGKGLFALDVTSPGSFKGQDVLWEQLSDADADLGYMLGRPMVAKMQNGGWAVIVGNGYNSAARSRTSSRFPCIHPCGRRRCRRAAPRRSIGTSSP